MQLSKLNSAIRAAEDVKVRFSFGSVDVKKSSLLDALRNTFTEGRTHETGLTLTEDGHLSWEPGHNPYEQS